VAKTAATELAKCTPSPDFGFQGAVAVNAEAQAAEQAL